MDYEEFNDKYHRVENYKLPAHRLAKIRPVPFVNIKKSERALLYINTDALPKIDDNIYNQIIKFPNFDYVNSIAYEMLIRTQEYKQTNRNKKLNTYEKVKLFDKLGVDFYEVRRFNLKNDARRVHYYDREQDLFESDYDLTIDNIDNGIDKLINFYLERKQILKRVKYKENIIGVITDIKYKIDKNATYDDIFSSPSDFYIPAKFDYENPRNKYRISKIDKDISLHALKNEFLDHIEKSIPNNIKGKILFNFTRPLLRFKESANVDVQINLNLSKTVILDLISKLKDEFDRGSVKTPIGFLYDKNYLAKDWKKNIPFKFTKKSMSRAFFVYDLYKAIDFAFQLKKKQLEESRDKEIQKIKDDFETKMIEQENKINRLQATASYKEEAKSFKRKKNSLNKQKENEIKEIKNKCKFESQTFNTQDVLVELLEKHKITAYTCKKYLQFMRKYIDNAKYKELIVGTETA